MQETSSISKSLRIEPAVFWAALSGALIIGWLAGLAPDYLGGFGRFILYWLLLPISLGGLVYGIVIAIKAEKFYSVPSAIEPKSFVLAPEELTRWRSIKSGMERHEVIAIIGQPDGPPVAVDLYLIDLIDAPRDYLGKIVYNWGNGRICFEPNGGPVFKVEIPEYI